MGKFLQIVSMKAKVNLGLQSSSAESTLCSLIICTIANSFALSNHHGVYTGFPRRFQEAPKLWYTQTKKLASKFP